MNILNIVRKQQQKAARLAAAQYLLATKAG